MDKYKVVDYFDVWGNEQDGWEVNNLAEVGYIEVKDYTNKVEVISKLVDIEFITNTNKPEVLSKLIDFWNDYEMIEGFSSYNGEPLFRLELVRD
jgi:hypothetical protein